MLRIMLIVIGVLLAVVAGVMIYATTKPDSFRVARTTIIKAPADKIYPLVVEPRRHVEWSPWEKKDPDMKRTYSGAPRGKGAVYEWDGNNNIGKGRMEVLEATAPTKVVFDMLFIAPFSAHNTAEITLAPQSGSTAATWVIYGPMPYMSKLMSVFMSFDAMIGKEFETGLANLKALTEK